MPASAPRADLIGRAAEIAELRSIMDARGAAVLVGEAGIGKSALLAAATSGLEAAVGGAFGMLRFIPYLALARAVGPLAERDPANVAITVVERVGDGILVIDDLHWADDATLEILDRIAGRVALLAAVRTGDEGTDRALAAARRAGLTELRVQPLAEGDGAELAHRWRPSLSPGDSRQLVARSGGNPLLIVELARAGVTTTLTLAIEHRLRTLPPTERGILELLAIADVPITPPGSPAVLDRLVRDGLLTSTDGGLAIRHALIAEVIGGRLPDARRAALHREVAARAGDGATRDRHLMAAGDREAAFETASAAAATAPPGLRAALLGLAAECADGPDAPRLRVEAAEALVAARLFENAIRALGSDDGATGELAVRRHGALAQIRWSQGDSTGALREADAAIALAEPGSALAARLLVDRAWIVTLRREGTRAVELAREALAAVRATALPDAAALRVLGIAVSIVGAPFDEYVALYEAGAASARAAGDVAEELFCAWLLVASHESGDQATGIALAEAAIARANDTGMGALGQSIRAALVSILYSHGDPARAVREGDALLAESIDRRIRAQTAGFTAAALVDLGRFDDARRTIAAALPMAPEDVEGLCNLVWAEAELALADGDPNEALQLTDDFVARFGKADYGDMAFMYSTHDWAHAEAGRKLIPMGQPARSLHRQHLPTVIERRAVRLLAAGDHEAAATTFAEAAEAFAPYHRRSEIRCRWGSGEALRRAGRLAEARAALEIAERLAGDVWVPFAGRIRRSLRSSGAHRSAPRREAGTLTAREREVLRLVADGLTNSQIAARLGITARTVATLLSNAAAKLGTRSRVQTALLAEETA